MTPFPRAPALELADVIRRHAAKLDVTTAEQRRVLNAIAACRTAALGGHVETCDHCRHQRVAYNSCRNRHCPRCQGSACARWMDERAAELLPVEYFHVVFTLPDAFNALALANPRVVYGVLFDAAARTLLEVAANRVRAANVRRCRELLRADPPPVDETNGGASGLRHLNPVERAERCPACGRGHMIWSRPLSPVRAPAVLVACHDTS